MGLLAFIAFSLLGQWLVITGGNGEFEMVLTGLFSVLGAPIALSLREGTAVWAGLQWRSKTFTREVMP
ncbi:hypothetical protein [Thermococcus waiotapuensis]|uniref:Uncharacterized protein n=1 Tax=Thermococcus waiotapuensis TaxID=90909 RepID=A0AAE4NWQ0_9EURY|nr:hypothetical protein [Thermococcus waiotapuensis]MDV3104711.1 hypothetical protein [Thermococcus waiotapuensis]